MISSACNVYADVCVWNHQLECLCCTYRGSNENTRWPNIVFGVGHRKLVCDENHRVNTRSVEQDDEHCMIKTCSEEWKALGNNTDTNSVSMCRC